MIEIQISKGRMNEEVLKIENYLSKTGEFFQRGLFRGKNGIIYKSKERREFLNRDQLALHLSRLFNFTKDGIEPINCPASHVRALLTKIHYDFLTLLDD
jgi:hypothetical protein